jgi:hypothetical protein
MLGCSSSSHPTTMHKLCNGIELEFNGAPLVSWYTQRRRQCKAALAFFSFRNLNPDLANPGVPVYSPIRFMGMLGTCLDFLDTEDMTSHAGSA